MVVANNGEWNWHGEWQKDHSYDGPRGVLAEWDGGEWSVIERKQFCEVTGPGGIHGAPTDHSPIWATGWDQKSLLLKLLDGGEWHTFRLPKASNTHDAGHGWYTEWPRIREVGEGRLLMTMHGMLFDFPKGFSAGNTGGIRPVASYLKMVVDMCDWDGRLVFACNDASVFENRFVNQPSTNLWFGEFSDLEAWGPRVGTGGVWLNDQVKADEPSGPILIAGYEKRVLHLSHDGDEAVQFTLETDDDGRGAWEEYGSVSVPAAGYAYHILPAGAGGEWLRVRVDRDCTATAYLHCLEGRERENGGLFASVPKVSDQTARTTGIVRGRGGDLGTLHLLAERVEADGSVERVGYYEVGPEMKLQAVDDPTAAAWLEEHAALGEPDFQVDEASVILTDFDGARYRLPKTNAAYDEAWAEGWPRGVREVITERSLLNCHGTFYELPRASSGGAATMKPVCTHGRRITDFASWRGMLVIAGNAADAETDGHYFASEDGKCGLWFGNVDDLWDLGKPRGQGGPWKDSQVTASEPSDPYLMTGYDRKTLELSHDSGESVSFTVEVDLTGFGEWRTYQTIDAPAGETAAHEFPDGYSARWVRVTADSDCTATAWLVYE